MGAVKTLSLSRRGFLKAGGVGLLSAAWPMSLGAQAPAQLPPLAPADRIDGPPVVSARAWAIADGGTGRFLWGHNQTASVPMASTTKIMTAWLVIRLANDNPKVLDETVIVSEQAAKTTGSSARIRAGDRLPVRQLLYGLLLPSGNDAATAFAEHFGPRFRKQDSKASPIAAFVDEMNRQAKALNMGDTHYIDPHGLTKNLTSARNLTTLAHHVMQNATFRSYVRTRRHVYEVTGANDVKRTLEWNNTNKLLDIEGYDGIKTGTTTAAGSCLVASGRRGDEHLFVVVLGATSNDSRYVDTRNLFRWAWRERARGA